MPFRQNIIIEKLVDVVMKAKRERLRFAQYTKAPLQ